MGPKKQGFWPRINCSQMKLSNFGSPSSDSLSKIVCHFSNKVVLKLKSSPWIWKIKTTVWLVSPVLASLQFSYIVSLYIPPMVSTKLSPLSMNILVISNFDIRAILIPLTSVTRSPTLITRQRSTGLPLIIAIWVVLFQAW